LPREKSLLRGGDAPTKEKKKDCIAHRRDRNVREVESRYVAHKTFHSTEIRLDQEGSELRGGKANSPR